MGEKGKEKLSLGAAWDEKQQESPGISTFSRAAKYLSYNDPLDSSCLALCPHCKSLGCE